MDLYKRRSPEHGERLHATGGQADTSPRVVIRCQHQRRAPARRQGDASLRRRACCLADGPDEVHRSQIARLELRRYQGPASLHGGSAELLPPDPSPELRRRPVWIA